MRQASQWCSPGRDGATSPSVRKGRLACFAPTQQTASRRRHSSTAPPPRGENDMNLRGAVALVTGGNGGLGQHICHALARGGAHVAVMYAQSREQAETVSRELTSRHQVNAAAFACDITDAAAVANLVGAVTARF